MVSQQADHSMGGMSEEWLNINSEIKKMRIRQNMIELNMIVEMERDNVSVYESRGSVFSYKGTTIWDRSPSGRLSSLHDHFSEDKIESMLTPQKQVPERKFNMTMVKKVLAGKGDILNELLESAKTESPPVFKVDVNSS
jgi:hypothetical protein